MDTTITIRSDSRNDDTTSDRTEVEIKVKVVLVNGAVDMPATLDNFHQRLANWVKDNDKAGAHEMNERRIAELSNHDKIAETSAKVLSLFGTRYAPRELFMSQVLSSLTTSDGATGMHHDLYQRVRMVVEAWLCAQVKEGKILTLRGKSGGVKAAGSDLAQAAE